MSGLNMTMTIMVSDVKEVKALVGCSIKFVKSIKECNFNTCSGFPLELRVPYRDMVSALEDLEALANKEG